jgi:ferrous iron transport protein A
MVLSDCRVGEKARITAVLLGESHRKRLMDLGLVSGTGVEVVRKAPLGDPMIVQFRGYQVSLRMSEARHIEISPL